MKKQTLALTILLALGVTACSSKTDTKYVTDTQAVSAAQAEATAAKTAQATAESEAAAAKAAQATAEAEATAAKSAQATAEAEAATAKAAQATAEADAATAKAAQAAAESEAASAKAAKTAAEADATAAKEAQAVAEAAATAAKEAQATAEAATAAAQAAQATAEANAATAKTAQTAAEQALATKVASLAGQGNSYFALQSSSYYATKAADGTLVSSAQAQTTAFPASCGTTNGCKKGQNIGANLATQATASYAGYSAIRENDGADTASTPQNSFYYYNTTPTTDKATLVNATYNGQVSYTRQNGNTILTNNALKLQLTDNVLSGKVTKTSGSGVESDVITFNDAAVNVATDKISFAGATVFHSSSFGGNGDIAGTYHGEFAGSNAEHVVGTFESNSTEKASSVQGAFSATK